MAHAQADKSNMTIPGNRTDGLYRRSPDCGGKWKASDERPQGGMQHRYEEGKQAPLPCGDLVGTRAGRANAARLYVDLATLAHNLCAGESTIEALVRRGEFPVPYHLGGKRLWKWAEVEATIAASRGEVAALPARTESIAEATRRISQRRG